MDNEKQEALNKLLQNTIDNFLRQIDGHRNSFPVLMNALISQTQIKINDLSKFLRDNGIETPPTGKKETITIPPHLHTDFIENIKNATSSQFAMRNLPRSVIVSMVSSYDALIGNLIRIIYKANEESLNSVNTSIPISEVLGFSDIEEIKSYVVEKQVETVLRNNHEEQLEWLERKIGVNSLRDFEHFKDFVEVMERRNLFVHADGKVSRQYVDQCRKAGLTVAVALGDTLTADYAYVRKSYDIIAETGIKVCQVVWRKLGLGLNACDDSLQDITFNYLCRKQYDLANNLLLFAMMPAMKHVDSEYEWVFRVNLALSYYLAGNRTQSDEIVKGKDWSALKASYRLAEAVLLENQDMACSIMREIGADKDYKTYYQKWPLFREFRNTDAFKQAYEALYKEPFSYQEKGEFKWKKFLAEAQQIMAEEEAAKEEKKE